MYVFPRGFMKKLLVIISIVYEVITFHHNLAIKWNISALLCNGQQSHFDVRLKKKIQY